MTITITFQLEHLGLSGLETEIISVLTTRQHTVESIYMYTELNKLTSNINEEHVQQHVSYNNQQHNSANTYDVLALNE